MLKLAALNQKNNNTNNNTTSNIIHGGLVLGGAGLGAYSVKTHKDTYKNRKQLEYEINTNNLLIDTNAEKIKSLRNKKEELNNEWDKVYNEYSATLDKRRYAKKKLRELTDEVIKADPSKKEDRLLYEKQYKQHETALKELDKRLDSFEEQRDNYSELISKYEDEVRDARHKSKTANAKLENEINKIRKAETLGILGAGLALYGTYNLIKNQYIKG